jgi:trehalose synthase-fused probable maltokinase
MTRAAAPLAGMAETELRDFVRSQRWFGARDREVVDSEILDHAELGPELGSLIGLLLEIRYEGGTHDVYQLLVRTGAGDEESIVLDALDDPATVARLLEVAADDATLPSRLGTVEFSSLGELPAPPEQGHPVVRGLGVEQSNSSVVVDDSLIVKLYRRLESGVNPELELLRFFARAGFRNVPELRAWWAYSSPVMTTTLGVAQRYLPGARDGWDLCVSMLRSDPEPFLATVERLGRVVGAMHVALGSDKDDPAFAPEEASPEALALLTATIDDEIVQTFDRLPDYEVVAPIAGRGDAVRELLGGLASAGPVGPLLRYHGDLHLGQVLWFEDDWYVIDFEGEPARSLRERHAKGSPLRDVAGLLRSFSYASTVAGRAGSDIETRARELFLGGYLEIAEGSGILPPSPQLERLIGIFELEKAVYELRYELNHRPDWVHIPVAGIEELLARPGV